MTTQSRATLLGFGLAALSSIGTVCTLGLYFMSFALDSNFKSSQAQTGIVIGGFVLVMLPGLLLVGIGKLLSIEEEYKKPVALGLLLPPILFFAYMGLTMGSSFLLRATLAPRQRTTRTPTKQVAPRPGAGKTDPRNFAP